jgi:putative flippase GtrA
MKNLSRKFMRYLLTGGVAAIVDTASFAFLTFSGLQIWQAATLSFLLAAVVNFFCTASFVFNHPPTLRHFLVFILGATAGLVLNVGTTWAAVTYLGLIPILAKITGIGVAFLFNFSVNVGIVFPDKTKV